MAVDYRGYQVYKCGPWTQGPYLCQALRLLEGFDLKSMGHCSADYVHAVTEAMKLAMADRDAHYGDPLFVDVPMNALLSDEYTQFRRPLIDMGQAALDARPGDPLCMRALQEGGVFQPGVGGTTTCVVADRWGNGRIGHAERECLSRWRHRQHGRARMATACAVLTQRPDTPTASRRASVRVSP